MYTAPQSGVFVNGNGHFHTFRAPIYQEYNVSQFVNIKNVAVYPVVGNRITNNTASLQTIINVTAGYSIFFFPQGIYLITDTLFFPAGSRVFGEAWSTITAKGSKFFNPSTPAPMIRIGNPDDIDVAQFLDMFFTVADVI